MNIYISDNGYFNAEKANLFTSASSTAKVNKVAKTDTSAGSSIVREAEQAYVAENTPAYNISISSMGKAALQSLKTFSQGLNNLSEQADKSYKIDFTAKDDKRENINDDSPALSASNVNRSVFDSRIDEESDNKLNAASVEEDVNERFATAESDEEQDVNVRDEEPEQTEQTSGSSNLTQYSEAQLRKLVNAGEITRTDMNSELQKRVADTQDTKAGYDAGTQMVMKQAIAAYNYQMSYQINAAMIQ